MQDLQIDSPEKKDTTPETETVTLSMGPQHPATHGTLRLQLDLDGETIVKVVPHIGYLHTGFEKLAEHLTYNQFITLSDRMNYLSPLNNNIGFAIACEKLFDIKVTKKCEYVRVIMGELSRIADHLVSIGTAALDLGAFTAFLYFFEQREKLYDLFKIATGTRLTTSYTRVGGMMRELPEEFFPQANEFLEKLPSVIKEVDTLLTRNKIWIGRTRDIGVVDGEEAINFGLTGPCLRGSGIPWDIRKNEPYSSYDDFDFDIPVGDRGDAYDRYWVRMEEMNQSRLIVRQALDNLPEGSVNIDDPKVILPGKQDVYNNMEELIHHFMITMEHKGIKPDAGEIYSSTESPNGELGFYIASDGTNRPYRVHVRAPSLANYQVLPKMLEGSMLSDSVAVLGSLNIIAGELDR